MFWVGVGIGVIATVAVETAFGLIEALKRGIGT